MLQCVRAAFDPEDIVKRMGEIDKTRMSEDATVQSQWEGFKDLTLGKWCGSWMTYNHMGDQIDDVRVDVSLVEEGKTVRHEQTIWVGQVSSSCERCADSVDMKTIPLGTYSPGALRKQIVCGPGIINGPAVLRSGAMSTEVNLRYGNGRLRFVYIACVCVCLSV
jgi:hypothetical protein